MKRRMPRVKEKTKTKKGRTASEEHIEGSVPDMPIVPLKGKKIAPIEDAELIVGTDEKIVEEEVIAPVVEEDETADEATLDDEEVNPFGDKWEE